MRLTCFVVWKSWVSDPLRLVLAVLGVALGVAIPTAIHVMDHNTIESRLRLLRPDFGRVDLELAPLAGDRRTDEVRAELAAHPDIAAVGLLQQAAVTLSVAGGKTHGTVNAYGLSPLPSEVFAHYAVARGEDLSDLSADDAVLIGPSLAELLDLEPGDRLTLARPATAPLTRCVRGQRTVVAGGDAIAEPRAPREVVVQGVLAGTALGRRDHGFAVVTSFALARELAGARRPLFQVNRGGGVDVDRLRKELATDFQVLDDRSALLGQASDERAFRNGIKVLGCLALVLGMFGIFQTLSLSLVERLRQIGLLRCLGTSRRTVAAVFLLDGVWTALLGAALGVGLGILLASLLQGLEISTLGRGKPFVVFEVPVVPVVLTALLGVLFTLIGTAFPLVKARNLPALQILAAHDLRQGEGAGEVDVLRGMNVFLFVLLVVALPVAYLAMTPLLGEESGETLLVLAELLAMVMLFGGVLLAAPRLVQTLGRLVLTPLRRGRLRLPAFLVGLAMQRNPGRFAASVCGVSIVLVAMIALGSITAALRADWLTFDAQAMQGRMFVRIPPTPAAQVEALLGEVSGIAAADVFEGEAPGRLLLRGLPAAALQRPGGLLEDAPDLVTTYRDGRGLVVSERLALLRDLHEGDALSLLTDGGPVRYQVLRVSDAVGYFPDERAWAVAAPRWLRDDFCAGLDGAEQIALQLAPDADPAIVLAELRERLDVPWMKRGEDITAYNLRDVVGDFRLFDVLLLLILALAALGLVNTMTIAALGRVRELGVLRALGMGRAALRWMFLVEGGVVALLAGLLALVLALPLGATIVAGLNATAGLEAPFVFPWGRLLAAPILALAVALVAALIPGLRVAARENPARAVRSP
ncbi:MAG: FtsX-like permease family protein [Planctomycetota bacterium]